MEHPERLAIDASVLRSLEKGENIVIRKWSLCLINQMLFQSKVGMFLLLQEPTQKAKERKQRTPPKNCGEGGCGGVCL